MRNTWTDLKPSGSLPAARYGSLMVYDPAKGAVVLFGGAETGRAFKDTWAYDPATNAWTDLKPAGGLPPARAYHAMVYDSAGGKVILFGGTDDNDVGLSDTWAYDPAANTWTNSQPRWQLAPRPLWSLHGVRLSHRQGDSLRRMGADDAIFNDTWAYDPATNTWSELHPAGTLPTGRAYFGMAYDSVTGKVFLFGGMGSGGDKKFDDTWAYDPAANSWTDLKPTGASPSIRCCHFMVYNSATGKVLLFGGLSDDRRAFNDTWAYDPAANTWASLQPTGSTPPARTAHRMAYDSETGMVFLFGGYGYDSALLNDTWVYGR